MGEEDINIYKKYISNLDITKYIIKDDEDNYWYSDKYVYQLQTQLEQKENIIKEVREYVEENWISQKDADNYRFDDEELNIEISDIAVLFDVLDKENK